MIFKTFKAGDVLKAQELNDLQEFIGQQIVDKSIDSKFTYGNDDKNFGCIKWEKYLDGTFSLIIRSNNFRIDPQSTAGMPETVELPIATGGVELPFDVEAITEVAWACPYYSDIAQHMNATAYVSTPKHYTILNIYGTKALFDSIITSTLYTVFDIYINGRWK
jgi:hypothetical protein